MTTRSPDRERRLLPRWRASAAAVASGELKSAAQPPKLDEQTSNEPSFDQLLKAWEAEKSIENAAELVSSAVVLGRIGEVEGAAKQIADERADVAPLLRSIVTRSAGDPKAAGALELDNSIANRAKVYASIAALKRRVRDYPRNAIAWMDLAHAQTVLGQVDKARDAVRIALVLARENRFVLRSAARFFVHAGDVDEGLHVLRRASLVRSDPWLMSAEIALSGVARRAPATFRAAKDMVSRDDLQPWHTSELHGALGTLELESGGGGRARKLFNKSLRRPTENAVAQAQWAAIEHHAVEVPERLPSESMSSEAIALKAREDREWANVLLACRQWSAMEPTSSRPLVLGGFVAEVALGNGDLASEFTERLLVTSPSDSTAINNHAVALAYRGEVPAARALLNQINPRALMGVGKAVNMATEGLLAYREGRREEGMSLYLEAAAEAQRLKETEIQALALWHLLREEARVDVSDLSEVVELLWRRTNSLGLPELESIKESVEAEIEVARRRKTSQTTLELTLPAHLVEKLGGYLPNLDDAKNK
jgi:tetratricopeptide (TPR) repeat protein